MNGDTKKRPLPYLITVGTEDAPRYLIKDCDDRYWTGAGWTTDRKAGQLYSDYQKAGTDWQALMLQGFEGEPVRTFTAPIEISVFGDAEIDMEQFVQWLSHTATLYFNAHRDGIGPTEGTLALSRIRWDQIEEGGR